MDKQWSEQGQPGVRPVELQRPQVGQQFVASVQRPANVLLVLFGQVVGHPGVLSVLMP